ncbi:MAG: DUF4397 domain-containing protein [Gammaproteobacteria bacterium]
MRIKSCLPFQILLNLTLLLSLCACSSDDSGDAQVRVLNVSTGYQSLDLYSNNDSSETDDDQMRLSSVGINTVSEYAELTAATYTLKFRRAGAASNLLSLAGQAFAEDTHGTLVAMGSAGHFQTYRIDDDQAAAASGKAKLTVVNAADAGSLDVYLTEESIPLEDTSPLVGALIAGSGSAAAIIDSSTYRLRITGAGDPTDLRLDVPSVAFTSTQVVSLVLTPTAGGVLVNVLQLPQQGAITAYANTKARIRAAAGMANGSAATVSVGGTALLNGATVGIIGSGYAQVTAGTLPVSLSIDGASASAIARTLVPGTDYTLLIWSDANGTQTTLVTDDNHLAAVIGNVKIRVLNGMSALGGPITFAVDYAQIADNIAVGQSSAYGDVLSGSDFQFDVTNSLTAAVLLTRSGVSLQSGGIYTMFLTGGGVSVGGTLRRDR